MKNLLSILLMLPCYAFGQQFLWSTTEPAELKDTAVNLIAINNERNDQANGDYINYLEMDSGVVIPTFGFKEDEEVVRQFESIFSGKKIMTLDSNDIANEGGVLNCITWNIKAN